MSPSRAPALMILEVYTAAATDRDPPFPDLDFSIAISTESRECRTLWVNPLVPAPPAPVSDGLHSSGGPVQGASNSQVRPEVILVVRLPFRNKLGDSNYFFAHGSGSVRRKPSSKPWTQGFARCELALMTARKERGAGFVAKPRG